MDNSNPNPSEDNLSKAERKALRRQEKEQKKLETIQLQQKSKMFKQGAGIVVAVLVILGIGYLVVNSNEEVELDITRECLTHQNLALHIHPHLSIVINGEEQEIPANTGIASATCMRPIHTHDTTGLLHVEYTRPRDFVLGEFFQIWDKPFSREQILDYTVDEDHEIVVTVNGEENEDYENLVLKDNDRIVIEYREKE